MVAPDIQSIFNIVYLSKTEASETRHWIHSGLLDPKQLSRNIVCTDGLCATRAPYFESLRGQKELKHIISEIT